MPGKSKPFNQDVAVVQLHELGDNLEETHRVPRVTHRDMWRGEAGRGRGIPLSVSDIAARESHATDYSSLAAKILLQSSVGFL